MLSRSPVPPGLVSLANLARLPHALPVLVAALVITACVPRLSHRAGGPRDAALGGQRILVTMKPAPAPRLGQVGSTASPYPGPSAYSVTERTRRNVTRIEREYDLEAVEGISSTVAKKIYDHFNPHG